MPKGATAGVSPAPKLANYKYCSKKATNSSPNEMDECIEEKKVSVEERDSNPMEKAPPSCSNGRPLDHDVRKRRLFATMYVLTTCFVAALSYYMGTLKHSSSPQQQPQPQIIVETLWATPLARTHLRTHPNALNLTQFNRQLADAVVKDYAAFQANYSDHDPSDVNDLFFEYQVGGGGEKNKLIRARLEEMAHRKLPEFRVVARCAATLADRLLDKFGNAALQNSERRVQAWATLHDSSSRHALHVHAASTLSIVYYVRMGEGAPLRLYDPRGPRPPFEGSVEMWPEEGEMIAFPGWLAHEVEVGTGRRISLVFNVPGNWEGDEFGGETVGLGRWTGVKGWKLDFTDGFL